MLHYDFDGDLSAGVVTDRSGSGLDGTLVNPGSATQTTGVDGSPALALPGGAANATTAPYVSIPNGPFRGLSAATISTWVRWSGGADFQWVYCIGKDLNTATFVTPSYSGVAKTRSSIKPVDGRSEVGVTATQKLPTGQWVNLVTTIDGRTDQVLILEPEYRDNIVFVPFNEPEGNMFGNGQWSYNRVSWLNDPRYFFAAWDEVYALIKGKMPDGRIAGPNTSLLFNQVEDFLRHTVAAGTVPDVVTWHELSDPAEIRTSVARYRGWEEGSSLVRSTRASICPSTGPPARSPRTGTRRRTPRSPAPPRSAGSRWPPAARAVTGVGGEPGNGNTLAFTVQAPAAGTYALTVRYSNPEQAPASHYNPDPLARPADISINGGPGPAGAVPAQLPRQQLLVPDHPRAVERGDEHDPLRRTGAARRRWRHLHQ